MKLFLAAVCCLLPIAAQTRRAAESPSFPDLMKQALAAREAHRLEESVALYSKALTLRPTEPEAWWYQGLNYYDLDRYQECAGAFGKLVTYDKSNGGGFALLGLCEFGTKRYENAFAHIVKGKVLGIPAGSELDRVAQHHYVQLLNKLGQFEAAAGPLTDLAVSRPNTPGLIEMAGINALRLPLLPPEIPDDKKEPVQLAGRAAVAAWQRKPAEAKKQADTLLERYPKLPNAHYLRGWLHLMSQAPEAIAEFRKELEVSPNHVQARLQVANEYLNRGEPDQGLPWAREAVKIAPRDFTAHVILGRLLLKLDSVPEATSTLETAVELAPTSPDAHFQLAAAYNRAGRKEDADRERKLFTELSTAREANR